MQTWHDKFVLGRKRTPIVHIGAQEYAPVSPSQAHGLPQSLLQTA